MTALTRRSVAWLLLAVSGLSLVVAWVLASPVGASPDEPAHISYAWGTVTGQTVNGERLTTIPPGRTATQIQVPQKLLQYPEPACYAFRSAIPAKQCSPIPADNLQEVTQKSYMSRYPPPFYVIEGFVLRVAVAAGLSGPQVLYVARLASALLGLLTVAFGVFLLSRRFPAHPVLLITLLALPATTWFLTGSVNPNGLEIAAAFLLAAGVLSVRADLAAGVRSVAAIAAIPLATLLLTGTRPLSWVWASLTLGLLLVPIGQRDGLPWIRRLPLRAMGAAAITATALVLLSSMAWFLYAIQIRSEERGSTGWGGFNPIERVTMLLLHTGTIISEQVGTFGWLDTPLPTLAIYAWVTVAAVAVAIWSVGHHSLVPTWALGAILGLGYLAALLDEYRGAWGWQGRYLLPITAALCVFALPGLVSGLQKWTLPRHLLTSMLAVLMAVNALSVLWFLFRNTNGLVAGPKRLPSTPVLSSTLAWTPPLGLGAVLGLTTLAFVTGVWAVWTLRPVTAKVGGESRDPSPHALVRDPDSALT